MNEETLFQEALSRSSVERAAFLDQACAGRPDLRAAVEELLVAHEKSDNMLDKPPAELGQTMDSAPVEARDPDTGDYNPESANPITGTTDFHLSVESGAVIAGRYTLVEKIGEGGMGDVWVAKQTEPVKRKVALKLIKAGMDSRAVLQRFEQERQALAIMEHPNIARVIDGGMTAERRPFFVMELVNGLPLTRFCDEAKMSIRERLELFASICQAVQHAHQKGIIHRDLKPSNILVTIVDGKPVPKVIDFGVAKATAGKLTDESLSTQFGAVVGTLEYMSPEQAGFSGENIDTRADIYSLGVILYELLTGLRPIDAKRLKKAALTEMLRIIKEEDPSKPSTRLSTDDSAPSSAALRHTEPRKLAALLRGELDWVVMKCLEKHRERRYETANGLARDIQRYLANEVVEARPPSAGYRLRKFVSRHRGQVLAASLLLLVLVGGIIGTTFGFVRAERARRAEAEQRSIAQTNEADAIRAAKAESEARTAEAEQRRKVSDALVASRRLSARYAFERGHQFAENNQIDLGMLWFGRALELAPEGAGDLERAIRTAMSAWSRLINMHKMHLAEPDFFFPDATELSGGGRIAFHEQFFHDAMTFSIFDVDSGRALVERKEFKQTDWSQALRGRIRGVLSDDGTTLALVDDRAVQLWDATTGLPRSAPLTHDDPFSSASFHPEGKLLVTASEDKLRFWNVATGRVGGDPLPQKERIHQVSFSPDGRVLLARGDHTIGLYDPATRREIARIVSQPEAFSFAQFGAGGTTVWTGFPGRMLKRWDSTTGNPIGVPVAVLHPPGSDRNVTIHPSGKFYYVPDPTAPYRDTATGQALPHPFTRWPGTGRSRFSPDGRILLTDNTIWDVAPGMDPLRVLEHPGGVRDLRSSPDGSLVSSVAWETDKWVIRFHRATTGQTICDPIFVSGTQDEPPDAYRHVFSTQVAFRPDGKVAVTAFRDNAARLWDTETGQPRGAPLQHQGLVRGVAFSPDGAKVATAGADRTIRLWSSESGALIGPPMQHEPEGQIRQTHRSRDSIKGVVFSPDGRKLLTWGGVPRTAVGWCRLWDVATGRSAGPALSHQGEVHDAAFSPDGTMFVTGSFRIRLWDTETCREIDRFTRFPDTINRVKFNADGKVILVVEVGEYHARLFDVATGQPIGGPLKDGDIRDAAFSPDGKIVATSTSNDRIRFWDAVTGLPIGPALVGGRALSFAPDGHSLLAGSDNGLYRWKVPTPLEGSRERLVVWTQVVTSSELDLAGTPGMLLGEERPGGRRLRSDGWPDRNRQLINLGGPPGNLDRRR